MRGLDACCRKLEPDGALQVLDGSDGRRILTEECLPPWRATGWRHPYAWATVPPPSSSSIYLARSWMWSL